MRETLATKILEVEQLKESLHRFGSEAISLRSALNKEKEKTKSLKSSQFHLHQELSNLRGYIKRVREVEKPEDRRRAERRDYRSSYGVRDIINKDKMEEASKPWWEV